MARGVQSVQELFFEPEPADRRGRTGGGRRRPRSEHGDLAKGQRDEGNPVFIVGDREDLLAGGLIASRVNWLIDPPSRPLSCVAKIRYRDAGASATVVADADGGARVTFAEPRAAIAPGQAVAFYDGERVLGGGWIERAESDFDSRR